MGRIAIPTWNGRISPVFDTALRLLLVDVRQRGEHSRFEIDISEPFLPSKTMRLTELRVETLICGAIIGGGVVGGVTQDVNLESAVATICSFLAGFIFSAAKNYIKNKV